MQKGSRRVEMFASCFSRGTMVRLVAVGYDVENLREDMISETPHSDRSPGHKGGPPETLDPLFSAAYRELHTLAKTHRRTWRGQTTLNTTALVHEVYLKLARQEGHLRDSRCLFAVAAKAMRHLLINYARSQQTLKRGGNADVIPLQQVQHGALLESGSSTAEEVLALDSALRRLASVNIRQSRVVECRFFGGLTVEETAATLDLSTATVKRDWRLASAWLYQELNGSASTDSPHGA
jgi:RNA polymerase sigma factor (TIGR02999 family)